MAKRRKKAKDRAQKEEAEKSKRFLLLLLGTFVFFVIAFAVLRWAFG